MSSLSNRNANNTRFVTLTPSSLTLFLKVQFILKSVIKGVLLPELIWWPISLIPLIKFLASECRLRLVSLILFLGEIMPSYSCYVEKRLFYITILVSFSCQPSFYTKYTKLNIYLSCDVRLVSNAKYICLMYSCIL